MTQVLQRRVSLSSTRSKLRRNLDGMPEGPPKIIQSLKNCKVAEGTAARFECKIRGNPEPEVEWTREGKILKESKQLTFLYDDEDNCKLIITKGTSADVGEYKVTAWNVFGRATSTARLIIDNGQDDDSTASESELSEPEVDDQSVEIRTSKFTKFYTVKEELGKGRFGVVFKCIDKNTGKEHAAKIVKCAKEQDKDDVKHEIEIMNSIRPHKRLLSLTDAFATDTEMVIVTELVTGGELFEKVIEDEYIDEAEVCSYMRQILEGVQHMHERDVLHLDLKPENIMLVRPDSKQIKLIDFGLARRYAPGSDLKIMFGTPEFVAPEVLKYEKITPATDLWSVGVIAYVLMSGLSPFMGETDAETLINVQMADWDFEDPVFSECSLSVKDFISSLLVLEPDKRATVNECLKQEWITMKKGKGKKIKTDRLKAFTARRKWKKAMSAIRSTNFLKRLLGSRGSLGDVSKPDEAGGGVASGGLLARVKAMHAAGVQAPVGGTPPSSSGFLSPSSAAAVPFHGMMAGETIKEENYFPKKNLTNEAIAEEKDSAPKGWARLAKKAPASATDNTKKPPKVEAKPDRKDARATFKASDKKDETLSPDSSHQEKVNSNTSDPKHILGKKAPASATGNTKMPSKVEAKPDRKDARATSKASDKKDETLTPDSSHQEKVNSNTSDPKHILGKKAPASATGNTKTPPKVEAKPDRKDTRATSKASDKKDETLSPDNSHQEKVNSNTSDPKHNRENKSKPEPKREKSNHDNKATELKAHTVKGKIKAELKLERKIQEHQPEANVDSKSNGKTLNNSGNLAKEIVGPKSNSEKETPKMEPNFDKKTLEILPEQLNNNISESTVFNVKKSPKLEQKFKKKDVKTDENANNPPTTQVQQNSKVQQKEKLQEHSDKTSPTDINIAGSKTLSKPKSNVISKESSEPLTNAVQEKSNVNFGSPKVEKKISKEEQHSIHEPTKTLNNKVDKTCSSSNGTNSANEPAKSPKKEEEVASNAKPQEVKNEVPPAKSNSQDERKDTKTTATKLGQAKKTPNKLGDKLGKFSQVKASVPQFGIDYTKRNTEKKGLLPKRQGGAAPFMEFGISYKKPASKNNTDTTAKTESKTTTSIKGKEGNTRSTVASATKQVAPVVDGTKSSRKQRRKKARKPKVQGVKKLFKPEGLDKRFSGKELPLKQENPEKYYNFSKQDLGRGKWAVVRRAVDKKTKKTFAAKIIKYDSESIELVLQEYEVHRTLKNERVIGMRDAYICWRYAVFMFDLVEGQDCLSFIASKPRANEEDICFVLRPLLEVVKYLHSQKVVHLDIRPANVILTKDYKFKLIDFGCARRLAKEDGEVGGIVGNPEFTAPEMYNYENVHWGADMWSVGVIAYLLLSGLLPFTGEDEDEIEKAVADGKWSFDDKAFAHVTTEAKDFVSKLLVKVASKRLTAADALTHEWFSGDNLRKRRNSDISTQKLKETCQQLKDAEAEELIQGSFNLRAFDEDPYESPDSEGEDEE